jgi:hypothetical protein
VQQLADRFDPEKAAPRGASWSCSACGRRRRVDGDGDRRRPVELGHGDRRGARTWTVLAASLGAQINALTDFATLTSGNVVTVSTAGPNFGKNFAVSYRSSACRLQFATAADATTLGAARGARCWERRWASLRGRWPERRHLQPSGRGRRDAGPGPAALAQTIVDNSNQYALRAARPGCARRRQRARIASFSIPTTVNGSGGSTAVAAGNFVIGGTPRAGETLTLNLGVTTPAPGSVPAPFVYQVRETVPLAEIAAGRPRRSTRSSFGFTASVDGSTLVIVDGKTTGGRHLVHDLPGAVVVDCGPGQQDRAVGDHHALRTVRDLAQSAKSGASRSYGHDFDYGVESKATICREAGGRHRRDYECERRTGIRRYAEGAKIVVVRLAGMLPGLRRHGGGASNALSENDATAATIRPTATPSKARTGASRSARRYTRTGAEKVNGVLDTVAAITGSLAASINNGVGYGVHRFRGRQRPGQYPGHHARRQRRLHHADLRGHAGRDDHGRRGDPTSRGRQLRRPGRAADRPGLVRDASTASGDFAYGVTVGTETLAQVATALANAINLNAAAGFRAFAAQSRPVHHRPGRPRLHGPLRDRPGRRHARRLGAVAEPGAGDDGDLRRHAEAGETWNIA